MEATADKSTIFPPYEAFYIESMLHNSTAALKAIEATNRAIIDPNSSEDQILDPLQSLIVHAGALSRYFWPSKQGVNALHRKRGAFLRESFQVAESSPLKNRELRNEIEHFDEILDTILQSSVVGVIIPALVKDVRSPSDGIPKLTFRAFYIESEIFQLLNKEYFLPPIVEEIQRIHKLLLKCKQNGLRLRAT